MQVTWYNGYTNMYHWSLKQEKIIRLVAVYTVMTLAVLVIVTFIVFFVLGFRFDSNDGRIEQYAFLQFGSSPSGATVTVDGKVIGSTPNKSSTRAGKHEIIMWRDGYETWRKSIDLKAGTITWLSYIVLVPKKLDVSSVANYESIYSSLAAPDGHNMLIQRLAQTPTFDLVNLNSDTIKSTSLTIPVNSYSQPTTIGATHNFKIVKWDDGGRYVLINHQYGDKDEWLVLDTQDVNLTKNITRLFNIPINDISFSGTSGNAFYVLSSGAIVKLDLSSTTMSKPLVNNVSSFNVYNSNILTYIGTDIATGEQVAGLYREGDESLHVLKTATTKDANLHIATTHYFNQNYIAISEGKKVNILSGSYPNTLAENATSMKVIASYEVSQDVQNLTFGPSGEYVLAQSGSYFASYNLEYQTFASSTIAGTGTAPTLKWLDDNYMWSDLGGSLTVREFDGTNSHIINSVQIGQGVTLAYNGRYLYSINKLTTGYQLQRVRMILP